MVDEDRAEQISARLVAVDDAAEFSDEHERALWSLKRSAPSDLAWLLAERAELLRRVETAEDARDSLRFELQGKEAMRIKDNQYLLDRVEAAERAGAVKAFTHLAQEDRDPARAAWLVSQAVAYENGAPL